jgi:hypothetical protein
MGKKSKATLREQMLAAEAIVLAELEWFFTCAKETVPKAGEAPPAVRNAALAIQGWLGAIATFHAGALALRYAPRDWPESIQHEFGEWSSVIVRLECAAHPSDDETSTSALETAAVQRLEEMLAKRGGRSPEVVRLVRHAFQHVRAAIRAYVKVRGFGPSVLPPEGTVG